MTNAQKTHVCDQLFNWLFIPSLYMSVVGLFQPAVGVISLIIAAIAACIIAILNYRPDDQVA